MKSAILFLCLILFYGSKSQQLQSAPAVARTGAYGKMQNNALHFTANQAALGNSKCFAAALYGEKRFLLQELSLCHLALVQPAGDGAFGLQLAYTGNNDFNTTKIGFAYGRNLSGTIDAGVQFNYFHQHIRGYGNAAQLTIEGGVLVHLSELFHAGFQLSNPAGFSLQKQGAKPPSVYTTGASYQPSQNLTLTIELIKTEKLPLALQTTMEYRFAPKFWAAAGINSSTAAFFIAAGFRLKDFSIQIIGSVHPQIGLTPALMLSYNDMDK